MNTQKLSLDEYITKAKAVHGNKYDYSLVEYKNSREKVKIICLIHGAFMQDAGNHLEGQGCAKCAKINRQLKNKKSLETFIIESKLIHGEKYDYSLVDYIRNDIKVKIVCPQHGIFEQSPQGHIISKAGCKKCAIKKQIKDVNFIEKANKVHKNKYDYSLVDYKTCHTLIKIICPIHGVFEQSPQGHVKSGGCRLCQIENGSIRLTNTFEQFVLKANKIHSDKYTYDKSTYVNGKIKTKIICNIHGDFFQQPHEHLRGRGCPKCKASKGEKILFNYLKSQGYLFEPEKTFIECRGKMRMLPFDFYLSNYNIAIEYQGEQHFNPIKGWGGNKTLERIQHNDKIKKEYCKKNNIYLIEIPYHEKDPVGFLERCITHHLSNIKARDFTP